MTIPNGKLVMTARVGLGLQHGSFGVRICGAMLPSGGRPEGFHTQMESATILDFDKVPGLLSLILSLPRSVTDTETLAHKDAVASTCHSKLMDEVVPGFA